MRDVKVTLFKNICLLLFFLCNVISKTSVGTATTPHLEHCVLHFGEGHWVNSASILIALLSAFLPLHPRLSAMPEHRTFLCPLFKAYSKYRASKFEWRILPGLRWCRGGRFGGFICLLHKHVRFIVSCVWQIICAQIAVGFEIPRFLLPYLH